MTNSIHQWRPAAWLIVALLAFAPHRLPPPACERRICCAGSSGILIGLGFILNSDGSYIDLDRKTSGRVSFEGSNVKFIGGHLDGYVGTGISGGSSFQIHGIGCSHN